eukprot:scaffold551298_cov31-Prasinocladus_malaysianus.AAC.1
MVVLGPTVSITSRAVDRLCPAPEIWRSSTGIYRTTASVNYRRATTPSRTEGGHPVFLASTRSNGGGGRKCLDPT